MLVPSNLWNIADRVGSHKQLWDLRKVDTTFSGP